MNKIAKALFIIGWVSIASGVILAFTNYQVVVGYEESIILDPEPIVEESFTVFISYVIAGVIVGIMMFGFAEIVKLLDNILRALKGEADTGTIQRDVESKPYESKFNRFVKETINK